MKINRREVLNKYDNRCAYCGEPIDLKTMQVDHIRPKRYFYLLGPNDVLPDYDADDIQNLNPACRPCNLLKGVWSLEQFRGEIEKQVERARLRSVNFRTAERFGQIVVSEAPIIFYFEIQIQRKGNQCHAD